jgi:hypothetical protein
MRESHRAEWHAEQDREHARQTFVVRSTRQQQSVDAFMDQRPVRRRQQRGDAREREQHPRRGRAQRRNHQRGADIDQHHRAGEHEVGPGWNVAVLDTSHVENGLCGSRIVQMTADELATGLQCPYDSAIGGTASSGRIDDRGDIAIVRPAQPATAKAAERNRQMHHVCEILASALNIRSVSAWQKS